MLDRARPLPVLLALALAACGGGTTDPPAPDDGTPHLGEAARKELLATGIDRFAGKAVIASETSDGVVSTFTFDPASGPICIFGARFEAYLQQTGSDKLLLFLGGGGACWTGFCKATPNPDGGILPLGPLHVEQEQNPFHGYNVLYLPYCDGSVFSGNNDVPDPMGVRHFHGRQNLAAGFDVAARLGKLRKIAIGGVSAGAYGTLAATAMARIRYPNAEIVVYDDSGPWIQNLAETADVEARIADWHFQEMFPASCTECKGGRGQLTAFMDWLLKNDDQIRVGMMSYYEDSVIGDYFTKLVGPQFKALLLAESGKLHDAYPTRVRRFMLEGDGHVLTLWWPNLVKVNGVGLRDWTAGLVSGDPTWPDLLGP